MWKYVRKLVTWEFCLLHTRHASRFAIYVVDRTRGHSLVYFTCKYSVFILISLCDYVGLCVPGFSLCDYVGL